MSPSRLLLAALAALAPVAAPAAFRWADRSPVNPVRANHAAGVLGNVLVVAGGGYLGGFNWLSYLTAQSYDPSADAWTPRQPMSEKRTWAASAVALAEVAPGVREPRLYVIGGTDVTDFPIDYTVHRSIAVYDLASDTWSTFPQPLPGPFASGMAAAVVDNLIWVFGGGDIGSATVGNAVLVVDPIARSIAVHPSTMPSPGGSGYAEGAAVAVGRKIYYLGGWEDSYGIPSAALSIFDVDAGTWSQGAFLPQPTANGTAVAVGSSIYLLGGWDGASQTFNDVLVYDTLTDRWSSETPFRCSPDVGVPATRGRTGASAHLLEVAGVSSLHLVGGAEANIREVNCHEYTALTSGPPDTTPPSFAGLERADESSCPAESRFEIHLQWNPGSDATPPVVYNVYRSADPAFVPSPATRIAADLAATSYTDALAGLDCGKDFTYVVRARDSAVPPNEDLNLDRVTVTPACAAPARPPDIGNRLRLVHPGGLPRLDWSSYPSPSAASHYHVYRVATKSALPGSRLGDASSLDFTDPGPGALEYYQVRAAIDCGDLESLE